MGHWPEPRPIHFLSDLRPQSAARFSNFHDFHVTPHHSKEHGCNKLIFSSSPSTRFDGSDVDGLTEEQMPSIPQKKYLQDYAKTKAMGEVAVGFRNFNTCQNRSGIFVKFQTNLIEIII